MTEQEPDTENVVYIDEYPELRRRVWLRRLESQRRLGETAMIQIIKLPERTDPDGAA